MAHLNPYTLTLGRGKYLQDSQIDDNWNYLNYNINNLGEDYAALLFSQTGTTTIANTITETTIFTNGLGSLTLPENYLFPGKVVRIFSKGFHSSSASPSITVRVKLGGTTIASGTTSSGNGTNDAYSIEAYIVCYASGASGTVATSGHWQEIHSGGANIGLVKTTNTTINTTSALTVNITIQWGTATANNTLTSQIGIVIS